MIKKIGMVMTLGLLFVGCTPEGRIFNENKELSPQLEWIKTDTRTFEVNVEDIDNTYEMTLAFRYITGFMFDKLKVDVTETGPSGLELVSSYDLKVIDAEGGYIGSPGLDIWDSEHQVEANKKYTEKGVYTYTIEHNMPVDPVNHCMEIGLIIDKSK
jgi:gliding motility-associated lipoprotein GldH